MLPVRAAVHVLVLASCGRVGFGDATAADGGLDAASDVSTGDPSLELLIDFEGTLGDVAKGRDVLCVVRGGTGCPRLDGTGSAAVFGGGGCLLVLTAPEFETQTFTVALRVRSSDIGQVTLLSKPLRGATATENSLELWRDSIGGAMLTTSGYFNMSAGTIGSSTAWHHVAATYSAGQSRTYFDGVPQATASSTTEYDADALLIGCDIDMSAVVSLFVGELDDVRYYSRVLSTTEISALAQ